MNIDNLVFDGKWYRGPVIQWQTDLYGEPQPSGTGDLIYNNCRRIIEENDKSIDAQLIHNRCEILLSLRKQWPDYMNAKNQCKTVICS